MKKILLSSLALTFTLSSLPTTAVAASRDMINIVGSSTVYPFSTVVAERYGKKTSFKTPKIESTGTGGGMKLFCAGNGIDTPDMSNASRRMKKSEFDICAENGVTDITEVLLGYDGIVIANSKSAEQMKLSRKDLFLALANKVPATDGSDTLIKNPYKTWKDVNPTLPAVKIEVLGPPPTSGTRDAFVELVMEEGCQEFASIKALKDSDSNKFKEVCHSVREDHAYIEAGENDNLIIQKLVANPKAMGIFGFSFLEQNEDKIQGSFIEGSEPSFETISDGSYSVSRPLYFYVKNSHVNNVPGIMEFLDEFTSESAMGEDGYLADKGLIPLATDKLVEIRKSVLGLEKLAL
ncbi:MAG: PstS family phosphate ABC transporter substrate-binding protein [Psychromonas sp.]